MITSNPYDGERLAGTVGFPLPGREPAHRRSRERRAVAARRVGVIEVKGPNVFKGYWRMPEKTADEFRPDGFFITGDLGRIDARGYVHIVGRAKDLIISGGFNVYPKEIESEIDAIAGVVESAVIGAAASRFRRGRGGGGRRARPARRSTNSPSARRSKDGSPSSSSPSACSSSTTCRATRWARCRRRRCARPTRGRIRARKDATVATYYPSSSIDPHDELLQLCVRFGYPMLVDRLRDRKQLFVSCCLLQIRKSTPKASDIFLLAVSKTSVYHTRHRVSVPCIDTSIASRISV